MALWTDVINPAELTGYSREQAAAFDANGTTLADIFPNETTAGVNATWTVNDKVVDVASYRSFDAETKIGKTAGLERKIAELAPLGEKLRFSEYDQLVRMGQNSPESVQAAADRLAKQVTNAIMRRLVQARGEALVSGGLAINEDGFVQNVDFGRRPDHTVTAAAAWNTAADPIADLEQWRAAYVDNTGVDPDQILVSAKVMAALQRNEAMRKYFGTNAPLMLNRDNINSVLVGYGLPALTVVTARAAGKSVLSDEHVVFTASGAGATVWGSTVEAMDPRYSLQDAALPGLVVGAYAEDDPNIKWIRGTGVALPILANPDLTLAAKVLDAAAASTPVEPAPTDPAA